VNTKIVIVIAFWLGLASAVAQKSAIRGNRPAPLSRSFDWGLLTQGGFGLTDNRNGFRFVMAGMHAGRILTPAIGPGLLRGNFEYAVELFPFWQSYTPVISRQNCAPQSGNTNQFLCSAPFRVGGTYSGVSITPILLRWNFAASERWMPWMQGGGGVIWTNHKYPPFGGPPVSNGGLTAGPVGGNGLTANTSVWNFTPQFGVGLHYFLRPNRSFDIGANAIHISSASLGDKNPGVNASVQFTAGYSWWK
jgi:lipid A 3-O-deacylase